MNLPISPPTDNLYKFLAITGLIIAGASVFIVMTQYYDFRKKDVQLGGEISAIKQKMGYLSNTVSQVKTFERAWKHKL